MIKVAGSILGEPFMNKEVGQALQMMDGQLSRIRREPMLNIRQMPNKTSIGSAEY